ncbi:hypothetical protein SBP18_03275 [Rhodoferax ferrireducens]|uniref:hypothetical protein n=1 Tax=Rhodoferax ferrireducens TaxID=192843 RepID=UPI00298E8851|nr:hypothetical protein [Rhodoferax ferrireducens]WPC67540.1 hypothetical protein SBP18_03275 [Rhodoferax ferrireducens]
MNDGFSIFLALASDRLVHRRRTALGTKKSVTNGVWQAMDLAARKLTFVTGSTGLSDVRWRRSVIDRCWSGTKIHLYEMMVRKQPFDFAGVARQQIQWSDLHPATGSQRRFSVG